MSKRHAVALRAFTHAGDSYSKGQSIDLDAGQFTDWSTEGVDLVRAATDTEIAKAKEAKPDKAKPDA